jgi:hypothetical protein
MRFFLFSLLLTCCGLIVFVNPTPAVAAPIQLLRLERQIRGAGGVSLEAGGTTFLDTNGFLLVLTNRVYTNFSGNVLVEQISPQGGFARSSVGSFQSSGVAVTTSNLHVNVSGGYDLETVTSLSNATDALALADVSSSLTMSFVTDEESVLRVRSLIHDPYGSPPVVILSSDLNILFSADLFGLNRDNVTVAANGEPYRFRLPRGTYQLSVNSGRHASSSADGSTVLKARYQFEMSVVYSRNVPTNFYQPRFVGAPRSERDFKIRWPMESLRFDLTEQSSFTFCFPCFPPQTNQPVFILSTNVFLSDGSNFFVEVPRTAIFYGTPPPARDRGRLFQLRGFRP